MDCLNKVLTEDETVLEFLKPVKRAFFFYRVKAPAGILLLILFVMTTVSITKLQTYIAPVYVLWIYIRQAAIVLAVSLCNYFVQKMLYAKKAYYITSKRILIVGGVFNLKYQTLNYRFIGWAELKRTPFSKMFRMDSFSITLIMNINKQFTFKFFTLTGHGLSYIENADKAYKQIVSKMCDR